MTQLVTYKMENITIDDIEYDRPIKTSDGKVEIFIRYLGDRLITKMPTLVSNDGVNDTSIILPLVCKNKTLTNKVITFFKDLEKKILDDIKKNATTWKINGQIKYKAIINLMNDNGENDLYDNGLIRLNIITSQDFNTLVFNKKKELLTKEQYSEMLNYNSYVKPIIEISSILLNDKTISINIITHQLRITNKVPKITSLSGYCFSDSEDDCDNDNIKYGFSINDDNCDIYGNNDSDDNTNIYDKLNNYKKQHSVHSEFDSYDPNDDTNNYCDNESNNDSNS